MDSIRKICKRFGRHHNWLNNLYMNNKSRYDKMMNNHPKPMVSINIYIGVLKKNQKLLEGLLYTDEDLFKRLVKKAYNSKHVANVYRITQFTQSDDPIGYDVRTLDKVDIIVELYLDLINSHIQNARNYNGNMF